MKLTLPEPYVIHDPVTLQILPQGSHILLQRVIHQRGLALCLAARQILVPIEGNEGLCVVRDVLPVIAILRERNGIFALKLLDIPGVQRISELFDLVSRVVDIEFPGHVIARVFQHGR